MALINGHYNIFNALNLQGRLFQDNNSQSRSSSQNGNQFQEVYASSSSFKTKFISNLLNKDIKKDLQQKYQTDEINAYENLIKNKKIDQTTKNGIKQKIRVLIQFLIKSSQDSNNKRDKYLDECDKNGKKLTEHQFQRILSDMLNIQDQLTSKFLTQQQNIEKLSKQEINFRSVFQFLLNQKWKGKQKTLFTPIFNKNIFDWTINPLIANFIDLQIKSNQDRVVFLNFGKQTYLNIRVISQKTHLMYISFYNQYNVPEEFLRSQNEKNEKVDNNTSFNAAYAHMIEQQVKQVNQYKQQQNLKNMMLFPLNLFISKDFDQNLKFPYQQFGTSSDIHYLFNNLCVNRVKKYIPNKIIIYIDNNSNIDPIHFADIIKTLSDISNNNIMLCISRSILHKAQQQQKTGNFFSKYMNNQLQQNDIMRMRDYVIAFRNVTSKQYYPISNKILSPSEIFRNDIRYDYITRHSQVFQFMKSHMNKIKPSQKQLEFHKKAINQATEQIKNQKDKIPYYQLITSLNTSPKVNLIHYHDTYQISRQGVIYEILKRKQVKKRKYLLKLLKQNTQKQILQSIKHINFYYKQKEQKNFSLIYLQEYSQVQIIQRYKKLLVTVFNYLNSKGQHLILRGITDINSTSVFLFRVVQLKKNKEGKYVQQSINQKSENVVYCGYGVNFMLNQVDVYYTWPLKIDIIQNFKSKITGKIYRPSVSDQIINLKTQFKNGFQQQFYSYRLFVSKPNKNYSLMYGCKFVQIPNSSQRFQLYACGGYCLQNNMQQSSFLYVREDINNNYQIAPKDRDFKMPALIGYNVMTKLSQKDKLPIYTFYGGKSPYFFNFKYGVVKLNLQNTGKITYQQNYELNNSISIKTVTQPGIFNTLSTYPENKITQKYFDQSERFRYTFRINLGVLVFDEVEIQSMDEMLNYPIVKFNPEMPDSGVAVQMLDKNKDKKLLYIEFIFHNPFSTHQPYFMTINKSNIIGQQHQNRIIKLNRKGYLVEIRVKDKRLIYKDKQCLMDFVGNLYSALYIEGDGLVKMWPNSIQVSSEIQKSLKHNL